MVGTERRGFSVDGGRVRCVNGDGSVPTGRRRWKGSEFRGRGWGGSWN